MSYLGFCRSVLHIPPRSWPGFSKSMVILANGHGSGRAVKQWRSSDVTSWVMIGSASPVGWYHLPCFTTPLLRSVCSRACEWTLSMMDPQPCKSSKPKDKSQEPTPTAPTASSQNLHVSKVSWTSHETSDVQNNWFQVYKSLDLQTLKLISELVHQDRS